LLEQYTYNHKLFSYQFDANNKFYSNGYYGEDYESGPIVMPNHLTNIALWRAYLNLPTSIQDTTIDQFIYQTSVVHLAALNAMQLRKTKSNKPIEQAILTKKNAAEIIDYLNLLYEYKTTIIHEGDQWDYTSYTNATPLATVTTFTKKCTSLLNKTKDVFLQWRLLYTAQRANHFNKHHAQANALFTTYYPSISKNNSAEQYWCEGMQAGALLRLKDDAQSTYYAARAFANSADQFESAMNTYLFSNRNWQAALPYCTSKKDSVYVALLEGANHTLPNMDYIQFVYNANPAAEELKLLWMREANKIEYFLNTGAYHNFYIGENLIDVDSIYKQNNLIAQYIAFANKILANPNTVPVQVTAGTAVASFYYHQKNYSKALQYLDLIKNNPKDSIETTQYLLLLHMATLKNTNQFNAQHFQDLLKNFQTFTSDQFNNHVGYYLLHNEIAPHFLQSKDSSTAFWAYVKANCFSTDNFEIYGQDYSPESFNSSNYATYLINHCFSIEQVRQLKKNFLAKKGKSDFETYLIKNCQFLHDEKFFDEAIAKKLMLAEQWDQALAMVPQLPKSYTERMGPNPANFKTTDFIDEASDKKNFSIAQIITLAAKLKANAQKPDAAFATDKLLYASLLYNLSFYGKNHYVLDNHWNHASDNISGYFLTDSIEAHVYINNQDEYKHPMHASYRNYFYLFNAEQYAKKALLQLATNEEKAKCTFLMAKCWQKRCTQTDYVQNSLESPYLANLFSLYKSTAIQEEIFNSCSYYRMYVHGKR
jgi:hypothetical protein